MSKTANLFNIQHFSVNDGPGIRTVVFFKGCPLNCVWCHNPESKSREQELSFSRKKCILCKKCSEICPWDVHTFENNTHHIDRIKCTMCGKCVDECVFSALDVIGKAYSLDEIMAEIKKDDIFFGDEGGVTFSGGEPFMQFDALYELLKICKKEGYSTCIETSGFTTKENIIQASKYTDYFLYDCKETNSLNHKKYVGADNKLILENLSALCGVNAHVILRCPIIPGINDRQEHFDNIAKIANQYSCIKAIELMPYHPLGITKAAQIGKTSHYLDNQFMEIKTAKYYSECIKSKTDIPVKVNGIS